MTRAERLAKQIEEGRINLTRMRAIADWADAQAEDTRRDAISAERLLDSMIREAEALKEDEQ